MMDANASYPTLLVIRISAPKSVAGLAPADEKQLQFGEELAFVQALLSDSRDCGETRVNGDELVGLFPNVDCAFEAACVIQQTCAEPGRSPTLTHMRMLLDEQAAYVTSVADASAKFWESDPEDRLIRRLPPDRIFATKALTHRLSKALRARFRPYAQDREDGADSGELYQAICHEEASTRIAIPTLNQETASGTCSLYLRWRENKISLRADGPSMTLGRGGQSDIQIECELASRTHARLSFQQTNFILADQSTNGTFVQIDDDDEVFLHHEQIVLRGSGVISLGRRVCSGRGKLIYFNVAT